MKKILSLALFLTLALCVNAQQRKTWDFTKGISDETLENLVADPNWNVEYKADGTFSQAVDGAKMSGELQANGFVIKELQGIKFGSGGLSGNKNWIIGSNKFRMSRKNETFSLRVAPGQTIMMKARSANGTADDRGFVGDGNMEYISGPEGGICLGYNLEAEGRDERGDYTLVWKVKEDIEGLDGDSLDVTIKASPNGGLDISSIQIDEGDEPVLESAEVAYIYDSNYAGYSFDEDLTYLFFEYMIPTLIENTVVKPIDVADGGNAITRDSLETFKLVVVSNSIQTSNPFVQSIKNAIAYVPMLNLGSELYETWGYGQATPTATNTLDIPESKWNNAIFKPIDENTPPFLNEDGTIEWFADGDGIVGYTAPEGSYFAKDEIYATAAGVNAIHLHNGSRNAYMMIPCNNPVSTFGDAYYEMVPNIIKMLVKTKLDVTKASKAVINEEYHHLYTTVSLASSTAKNKIYYTVDGSEPTTESTLYTEPFDINAKDVTVKAIVTADGYNTSDVQEKVIAIYELANAPEVSYTQVGDTVEVTIVPVAEEAVAYYNFTGSNAVASSSVYESTIKLTKHATITVFTGAYDSYLASEPVSKDIVVNGEKVRIDIVSHMNANKSDWTATGANPTNYNGKNGHAYYSDEIIETTTDPDSGEEVYTCAPSNEIVYVNPGKGWEVRTEAQAMLWQNNGVTHNIGDGNGYNPETALDDDVNATSACISFGPSSVTNSFGNKNPAYTGSIQSTEAFQGPFDIVTNIATTKDGVVAAKAFVTTDTLSGNWTELGEFYSGTVKRLWKNNIVGYEGTDKVFVKICADDKAAIFDIFIKNEGELSKEYINNTNGIKTVNSDAAGEVVRTMIYSINGTQLDRAAKGINIVKEVYANGAVKTKKVILK